MDELTWEEAAKEFNKGKQRLPMNATRINLPNMGMYNLENGKWKIVKDKPCMMVGQEVRNG